MEISSVNQAWVFLWMVVCGIVCTFVFDVFRGIRRYKSPQNSVIVFQDLVLWAIEIFIVYMVAFKLNYAKVRVFEIVALIIGSVLYFIILSDYVVKSVCRITEIAEKCVLRIISPFRKMCNFVIAPVIRYIHKVWCRLRTWCNVKSKVIARGIGIRKKPFSESTPVDEENTKTQNNS